VVIYVGMICILGSGNNKPVRQNHMPDKILSVLAQRELTIYEIVPIVRQGQKI
jgi:hypothetical protein